MSPETKVVLGGLTRTYPLVEYFASNNSYPDFSGIELANGATVEYLKKRIDKRKANYDSKGSGENVERVLQDAEYDIIDIHLYDDPENWPEYLSMLPEGLRHHGKAENEVRGPFWRICAFIAPTPS